MCLYVYLDFALWRLKVPSSRSDFLHFRLMLGLSPVWAGKCRLTFEAWLNNFLHSVDMWRFSPLHVLDKVEMFHCEIIALLGLICLFPSMSINMVFSIFSDFSCWCFLSGMPFEEAFENTHWRKFNQMQPMWLCILIGRQSEETFENTQWGKSQKVQPAWLCIFQWRCSQDTSENAEWRKSQPNATNISLQPLR